MEFNESFANQIDQKTISRIRLKIYLLVRENLRTKKLSSTDISDKIRKIIEFEVNKNEN